MILKFMTSNKKHTTFIVAMVAIVLVVGGLIYHQERIIQEGETTILATRPVDPRDLFRGEYVILRYAIESDDEVDLNASDMRDGTVLYIKLGEDSDGIAQVSEVSKRAPRSFDGLWIAGEITSGRVRFPSIEQFYVPEGSGTPIERLGNDLHVEVVLKDGEARVVNLLDASLEVIDPNAYIE